MEVIYLKNFSDIRENIEDLGLILGLFDGVHIGHVQLISYAKANTKNGSLGVLTFDRALKSVEGSLMNLDDKINEFKKLGVDYTFIIVCDDNFKKMSYKKFVSDVLKVFNPKDIFCGPDFRYGYGAQGDVDYLKSAFTNVHVLSFVKDHFGNKISSSSIKENIKNDNLSEANRHLGRVYSIRGAVVHGFNEGSKIGYPTANLLPDTSYVLPSNGVYFTRTLIDGTLYDSLTNIGVHPTVNKLQSPSIEIFIIDERFDNLYGKTLKNFFYGKVRDEKAFSSLNELKIQINQDVVEAKNYFKYKVKN